MANWSGSAAAYRKRAAELRAEAEAVNNDYVKRGLLDQAANFDQLARLLDKQAAKLARIEFRRFRVRHIAAGVQFASQRLTGTVVSRRV
jgi:hypothetical protein